MSERRSYGLPDDEYYMLIEDRIKQRKEERRDKKRKERKKLRVTFLLVVVAIAAFAFTFTDFFAITSIEVQGNSYFAQEEIINMAHAAPGSNIIYRSGKKSIISYLEANPYIKKVAVSRKLPSTLVIKVVEREQVAAIVYDDDYLILDAEGVLLRKTKTEPKLSILEGIKVKKIKLGEKLEVDDETVLDNALSLISSMIKGDLYFKRIKMTELYITAYIYDTLICKGTADYLIDAIDKGRLHKVMEDLFEKGIKRGTITISEDGYASFVPSVE